MSTQSINLDSRMQVEEPVGFAPVEHGLKSMPPLPLVSIIIPAYKVAPYIAATLDSVFAQTYLNYEVIVVNDGSPDTEEFEEALQPYLDRIRYLKQENLGASVARNKGVKAARSEFIAFLDADDVWRSNYLHEQLKFIRDRKSALVGPGEPSFGKHKTEA